MAYIEAKAHIVTDTAAATALMQQVVQVFTSREEDVDWHEVGTTESNGFVDVVVKCSGEGDAMSSSIEEALHNVAALDNGQLTV